MFYNIDALANLINCFLETSCKPNFRRNQFHEALFNFYVLEDTTITKPDIPPYFKGDFFPAIQRINSSPLGLSKINVKQIYRFLVEEVTMNEDSRGIQSLKPIRVEAANPTNQWDKIWGMARQSMLGPSLTTFLFKLLHQILPTADRVSRILPNQSPNCTRCRSSTVETLHHAMFDCSESKAAGSILLQGLRKLIPIITSSQVLTLNFDSTEDLSFPLTWATAHFLSSLWQLRTDKKKVEPIKIRTDMEASCRLLRESRHLAAKKILYQIFPSC